MQEAIKEDRERGAVENVEWDQAYEDDPGPSLRKRVQFKRSAVTGEKMNTNPRKRAVSEAESLDLASKSDFIGPHQTEDQVPPGVRRSALKRFELQEKQDREWEELKDADRLLQQTQLWRSKTFSWRRQLLGIRASTDDEVRHDLPNELRSATTLDEASRETDGQLHKEQEFADKLQEEFSKV
ncbi:hypothetical protein AAVH_31195 [Aphelenchoides avenae]|nr:hypothetical protein AAVH_31195 [Aphelenchus avenae]